MNLLQSTSPETRADAKPACPPQGGASPAQATTCVAAVVVTRNRLSLLRECLSRVRGQSRRPDAIYVVDNASDDGTAAWLRSVPDVVVIRQANLGGAGGFHTGLKRAIEDGFGWIWLMDDDTFPEPESLAALLDCGRLRAASCGFLSSLVLWKDGATHRMNSPVIGHPNEWLHSVGRDGCIPIQAASFVSLLVRAEAVAVQGLPLAEMFVWFDDMEFTMRLAQRFEGWLVLGSRVCHATDANLGAHERPVSRRDPRFACLFRNWGILMRSRRRGLLGTISDTAKFLRHNRGRVASLPAMAAAARYFATGLLRPVRPKFPTFSREPAAR